MEIEEVIKFMLPGAIMGSALGSLVLTTAILYLSMQKDAPRGLNIWGLAFGINMLRMLSFFLKPFLGAGPTQLLNETLHVGVIVLFLAGTWAFLGRPVNKRHLALIAAAFLLWLYGATIAGLGFLASTFPFYVGAALVHAYVGWSFIIHSRRKKIWGGQFIGLLIFLWGVHKLNYPWLRPLEFFAPAGFALAELLALSIAVGMLLMAQRRQSDIAEKARHAAKESQRRLQLSEGQLNAVLHGAADGILTLDSQGLIQSANPSTMAMFGLAADEVIGQALDKLIPGGEAMAQSLAASGANNGDALAKGFECLGIRRDGSHVPLELTAAEIMFEGLSHKLVKLRDTSDSKISVRIEDMMGALTRAFAEGLGLQGLMTRLSEGIANIFWLPLVWVGFSEKDGSISVKGSGGAMSAKPIPTDEVDAGGPAARAIATGDAQPVSINDNRFGEMLDPVWKCGFQAMAAIPLSAHSKVVAVLHVYSQTEQFPPTCLSTLDRLSGRLGLMVQAGLDQERLELMAAAMEASSSAIVIADSKGGIEWGNAAFCRSSGYSADEVLGRQLNLLAVKDHGGAEFDSLKKALESGQTWHGEMVERRKDGSLYTVEQTVTPMLDAKGRVTHYVVVQEDLTEKRRAEERIRYLSHYDTLTALPNRHLFLERLKSAVARALESGYELALLFVDLDQFSRVNDTLGHTAGDKLLIGVVERLRIAARAADTLARIGGDEFGIILVDPKASDMAASLASRINGVVAEPFHLDGHEARLGANVGIAVLPNDGTTPDDLVRNADLALYRCIREHPGSYRYFSQDMNDEARSRLGLERDLRRAIEQNEFVLHYQPQLDAKTGRIVGVEALVRWQHPERGMIPPIQFIPVAEDTGLIVPLGEWVLIQACRQARIWKDMGLGPVTMAVNISAVQFFRQDVVAVVKRILSDTGLDASWLELELTESMVMHDAEAAILTLNRLNEIGLKMSIDDFGTGYSSLNYLRRFPVHRLKIDQSFVRELTNSANDAEIARAIISLGHSLELEVVSEGVETEAQQDYLKREGCDLLQGYLFSRPVPADEATTLLKRQPFENPRPNFDSSTR
ncbi:MAG: EAL domain-containing protein [Rhodospirillales bacterium]|nr:EAL domain-containing protein [Rhodospirillales bacterium]